MPIWGPSGGNWQGPLVDAINPGTAVSAGTLSVGSGGTVSVGAGKLFGNYGTVSAGGEDITVGANLTLQSNGTLVASGASGGNPQYNGLMMATSTTAAAGAYAIAGNLIIPNQNIVVSQVIALLVSPSSGTYQAIIASVASLIVGTVWTSGTVASVGTVSETLAFSMGNLALVAGVEYFVGVARTDSTGTAVCALGFTNSLLIYALPGFKAKAVDASGFGARYAGTSLTTGNTLVTDSTNLYTIGLSYSAPVDA